MPARAVSNPGIKERVLRGMVVNAVSIDAITEALLRKFIPSLGTMTCVFSIDPVKDPLPDFYLIPAERVAALARTRSLAPDSLIVAYGPSVSLPEAFAAGAVEYLKEPWTINEMFLRLRRLSRDSSTFVFEGRRYRLESGSIIGDEGKARLTEPERVILLSLMRGAPEPLSRRELYDRFNPGKPESSRVLDMHIHVLRTKLMSITGSVGLEDIIYTSRYRGYGFRFSR
jgi:DNA-binding winged helix-turn-helix (wHTH) protein